MKRGLGSSLIAATLALIVARLGLAGQTAASDSPTYDVVSIKPAPPNATSMNVATLPGGRFVMSNGDARMLIQMAYPSRTNELVGAPAWVRTERFDVAATSSIATPTEEQRTLMMRALMTDRFKLAAHYEPKEIDAFALMLAREDGRLGPQIHRAEFDCEAISAARARGEQPPPPTRADGSPGCGSRGRPGVLTFGGTSMAVFAGSLSSAAGRLVVDKTGLTGRYDVTLEYAARTSRDAPAGAAPPPSEDRPDIATALREQLGFKLAPERMTVQIVVIDHIEHPTGN
ncbi:MAG TPA: TIGR03435 family protein [Vicinamibacterales bacterium]|jgi:uncharacterized protein (TIGR03435 family)